MRDSAMTSSHPAPHKPAELFRADLISAMKLPDSMPLESGSFLTIKEPWRTEWEIGVQVCVSPDHILEASTRGIHDPPSSQGDFEKSQRYIREEDDGNNYVMYDLDELDLNWLESVNAKRKFRALASPKGLEEETLREALLTLETKCQQSMARAVATEETLGIEYDEQTTCDVCRDHESEDTNDMIFCDSCNVCVHQACYGVATIPQGEWLCRVCSVGDMDASCILCTIKGGALKRVRPGNSNWAHLCCALWIPEVRVGNADKMEPITNIDAIPPSRRNLVCCICKRRFGACIQCSYPLCVTAYHVTCGFQQGLDMKTRLDMATNAVIHESYCPKHTAIRKSPTKHGYSSSLSSSLHRNYMNKPSQLVQLQESFYNYASPDDLIGKLKLSHKLSTLIYNYWKLKRKFQHNRPLLSHLPIETSLESIKAELAAGGIKYGMDVDESFLKIVHLRQNLEKARNLVYMVQRRERLKKKLLQMQLEKLNLEANLEEAQPSQGTSTCSVGSPTVNMSTVQSRSSSSELDSSSDLEVDVPPRQTRSMTQQHTASSSATESPPGPSLTTPTLNNIDSCPLPNENHVSILTSTPILPTTATAKVRMNGPSCPPHHHTKQRTRVKGTGTSGGEARTDDSMSDNEVAPGTPRNLRRRELRGNSKLDHSALHTAKNLNPVVTDGGETPQTIHRLNSLKLLGGGGGPNGGLKVAVNGSPRRGYPGTESQCVVTVNHRRGCSDVEVVRGNTSDTREESHVLRSRKTSQLRVRPYAVNHKPPGKSS